ncbi:MAG: permease [Desulfuromonadales bacterium]|nr:permease [Desulfuromonadales bacterium]
MTSGLLQQMLAVIVDEITQMWWFFLLSILLVGIIKGYRLDMRIRNSVNRHGMTGVVLAVLVGLVSPLCACGILPIVISLAMMGTPLAPILALLATSPTMSPDAFLLTWQGLGPDWAWLKLGGATLLGLGVGSLTLLLQRQGLLTGNLLRFAPSYRDDGTLASAYEIGREHNIPVKTMTILPRDQRWRFILDRTLDAGLFTGKYLLLAIVLEAIIVTTLPMHWIVGLVGQKSFTSVSLAALVGIPLPLSQIPAIPILAGLLQKGMDHSAALTLLLAGPVTSLPAIIALTGLFKLRVMIFFIVSALGIAVILGGFSLFFLPLST